MMILPMLPTAAFADVEDETLVVSGGEVDDETLTLPNGEFGAEGETLVQYAAKIGEIGYATLAEAVAAAKDGDTVTLLKDLELTETVDLPEITFTLDLGGKTVWAKGAANGIFSIMKGNVTIQNGTVKLNGPSVQGGAVYLGWSGAKLNLVNATVEAYGDNCPILAMVGAEVTITDSTLIENGEDACIHATEISSLGTTKVTVNSGTFIANGNTSGFAWAEGGTIEIKGGKFSAGADNTEPYPFFDKNDGYGYKGTVIITGGYYDREVDAKYIAPGYICINTPKTDVNYPDYPYMIGIAPVAPSVAEEAKTESTAEVPTGADSSLAEKVVEEVIKEITDNTAVTGEGASNIQSETVENALKQKIAGMVDSSSQLKITVKSVATTTTETSVSTISATTVTTTSAKYDVKPYVTIETTDEHGTTTTETRVITNDELAAAKVSIQFRLAVPESMKSDTVLVKHYPDGATAPDWSKTYAVQDEGSNRYVELEANSFSIYEIADYSTTDYVALNINTNTPYTTLEEALKAAQSGETVILLKNIGGEGNAPAEKLVEVVAGITLDLNGHNITGARMIYANGKVIDTAVPAHKGTVSANVYFFAGSGEKEAYYLPIKNGDGDNVPAPDCGIRPEQLIAAVCAYSRKGGHWHNGDRVYRFFLPLIRRAGFFARRVNRKLRSLV